MSKLCRATCRVVVEVVVAKLDNWLRHFSGIAKFSRIRKNEFGRLQMNKPRLHQRGFCVTHLWHLIYYYVENIGGQ